MNTVEAASAVIKHSDRIEVFDRSQTVVALLALSDFLFGLGQMHIDRRRMFVRELRHRLHQIVTACVFSVDAELIRDQIMIVIELQVVLLQLFNRSSVIVESADHHRTKACLDRGLCKLLREKVHVKIGGDTAGQILHDRKL